MKTRTQLISIILAVIAAPLVPLTAEEAESDEQAIPLPPYTVEVARLPVPVKIFAPRISLSQVGEEAYMLFTIKANGCTTNVEARGSAFDVTDLEAGLVQVIRGWTFEPALDDDGNPVAVDVGLPVKVVRREKDHSNYAAITFTKLDFIRRS